MGEVEKKVKKSKKSKKTKKTKKKKRTRDAAEDEPMVAAATDLTVKPPKKRKKKHKKSKKPSSDDWKDVVASLKQKEIEKDQHAEKEAISDEGNENRSEVASSSTPASPSRPTVDAVSNNEKSVQGPQAGRSVYVAGIPYSCTEDDIWALFEACGVIEDLRMPRWHDSGNPRGYAHIDFSTADACTKALKLDGHVIKGRYLAVKVANAKRTSSVPAPKGSRPEGCKTLFIKNIPYETEEGAVREAFEAFGDVANVRLSRWHHTGNLKGFGYITFSDEKSVDNAIAAPSGVFVGQRRLYLDYETGKPRAGFKDATGRQWSKMHGEKNNSRR